MFARGLRLSLLVFRLRSRQKINQNVPQPLVCLSLSEILCLISNAYSIPSDVYLPNLAIRGYRHLELFLLGNRSAQAMRLPRAQLGKKHQKGVNSHQPLKPLTAGGDDDCATPLESDAAPWASNGLASMPFTVGLSIRSMRISAAANLECRSFRISSDSFNCRRMTSTCDRKAAH